MWTSLQLTILALLVTSGATIAHTTENKDPNDSSSTLSANDVDFRIEGLKKLARTQSADGRSSEELGEQEKIVESGEEEAPGIAASNDDVKSTKKGRKHKAFFLNYPFVPNVRRYQNTPNYETSLKNRNDFSGQQKPGHRKRFQQESQIYYIKLPPTPYMFVPGLGYISQPPTFSTAPLQRPIVNHIQRPVRPHVVHQKPTVKPFINVPIDFVSNGKPTGVYQWTNSKRRESTLNSLNEGPYVFNGRPTNLYLLTPDGQQTGHQPIRLADYSSKGYY